MPLSHRGVPDAQTAWGTVSLGRRANDDLGLEVQIGVEFAIRQKANRWGVEQSIDPTDTLGARLSLLELFEVLSHAATLSQQSILTVAVAA
jgi:hypothetical protein